MKWKQTSFKFSTSFLTLKWKEIKKQLDTPGKLKIIWIGKGYRVITYLLKYALNVIYIIIIYIFYIDTGLPPYVKLANNLS